MRALILGGDGFCGWLTALQLSAQGHEVAIVDNLSRPEIDVAGTMGVHGYGTAGIPCVSAWSSEAAAARAAQSLAV